MPPDPPRLQLLSQTRVAAARRRRRRRGQSRLAILIAVVTITVVVVVTEAAGRSAKVTRTASVGEGTSAGSTGGATGGQTNPLTTRQVSRYLAGRQGSVSAAVEDLQTGAEFILHPHERDQTGSIVKADILETLLYQAQQSHTPLADVESDTAEDMIEESDNDDATALWDTIGGAPGLDDYDEKIGMTHTSGGDDGYWGETLTTASDQIKLLQQLAEPQTSVLHRDSIAYQLSLMENIDQGENWGATGGVPTSGVTVALKNGWVPLTSDTDWEVNTIGWVKGDGHDYLIALLSAHDPSEDYGIDTLDALSKDIYDTLGPAPKQGTPTIQVVPSG